MEFPWVLIKEEHVFVYGNFRGQIKKKWNFHPGVIKKKS